MDKYGDDVESQFCESFTPYVALHNTIDNFSLLSDIEQLKYSVNVWVCLLELVSCSIEESIDADFVYYIKLNNACERIGYLVDVLTDDIVYTIDVDELINANIISKPFDIPGLKYYFETRGVMQKHHTLIR
jgi:hypothetical protein